MEGGVGHMASLSPDGVTFYVTQSGSAGMFTYAVDISDTSNPVMMPPIEYPEAPPEGGLFLHDAQLNPPDFPNPGDEGGIWLYGAQIVLPDQLLIMDVSDYQHRSPTPEAVIVGTFPLDPGTPEPMVPAMINGVPSIITTDESGGASGWGSWAAACEAGASPFGYSSIVDVSDHSNPRLVIKLWLEVHDPANCEQMRLTTPQDIPVDGPDPINYSLERCIPDNQMDAKLMACTGRMAGLRVWDIRDPQHVREVAYFKPGATRTTVLPGARIWSEGADRTVDRIAGWPRWVVEQTDDGPEVYLWTVSDGNGLQILRFTDHFRTVYGDLFEDVFGS
jgi:hypothetical protein